MRKLINRTQNCIVVFISFSLLVPNRYSNDKQKSNMTIMKLSNLVIVLAVVTFNFLEEVQADECHDFVKKLLGEQLKFIVPCIEKLGLKTSDQKKEKVFCIMRCVMQDAKMLGADGNVDFDLITKTLDSFPPAMKDKASGVFSECGHHAASLDPAEATCQSYAPLITCITDISVKLCN